MGLAGHHPLIFLTLRPRGAMEGRLTHMGKKIFLWGSLAFVVLFIAYNPHDAADVVMALGRGLVNMAQGFGDFISELFA
jgi:hypothetical protein